MGTSLVRPNTNHVIQASLIDREEEGGLVNLWLMSLVWLGNDIISDSTRQLTLCACSASNATPFSCLEITHAQFTLQAHFALIPDGIARSRTWAQAGMPSQAPPEHKYRLLHVTQWWHSWLSGRGASSQKLSGTCFLAWCCHWWKFNKELSYSPFILTALWWSSSQLSTRGCLLVYRTGSRVHIACRNVTYRGITLLMQCIHNSIHVQVHVLLLIPLSSLFKSCFCNQHERFGFINHIIFSSSSCNVKMHGISCLVYL